MHGAVPTQNAHIPTETNHPKYLPWLICFAASLFFFYEFIQSNMFNAMDTSLMAEFHVDAAQLGKLSAFYYIANVIFLLPAGSLLDRVSVRLLIIINMALCVAGTVLFAFAHSFYIAELSRFLSGIGSAFCFLSAIRLASRWFPAKRMALVSGLIVTMAMIGGMVAQTPMTYLTEQIGWRHALLADAGLGVLIIIFIALVVKDYPSQQNKQHSQSQLIKLGFSRAIKGSFLNIQNWLCGIFTCLLNTPVIILGALFGGPYFIHMYHMTAIQASYMTSVIFLGIIFGGPVLGYLSDKIGLRKPVMAIGGLLTLGVLAIFIFIPHINFTNLILLCFALGFFSSAQVISYPTVTESNPLILTATSVSVVSLSAQGGTVLLQPLAGWLLDIHNKDLHGQVSHSLATANYPLLMQMMAVGVIIGLVAVFFMRETRCQRTNNVTGQAHE